MIRWIVDSSLAYRHLVVALAVVAVIFGFTRLRDMPVDVFPEFEPPRIEIQTEALGLSASEVESLVTLNIEEFLSGTPWLETMRSESVPGLSSIQLVFTDGTDLMRARQLVQESLSRAYTLPNVSKTPVMLQPLSTTRRAMMVGLSSKELSPIQMSVLAQWTIRPRLLGVPGVANVVIWGQKNRQLQVQIDPKLLEKNGVTQDQIIRTTGDALWISQLSFLEASLPGTGGWIDTPNQRLGIRHVLPISTPEDLAKLPIYGSSNLLLGDVAKVVEGHPPLIGDTLLDDSSGLILVIEKLPGANTLTVIEGVKKALEALQAGLPGVKIDTNIFSLANFIETAIDNLTWASLISAALVVLALFLLLYNWRAALISILVIPLSILTATLVLYFLRSSINIMVLTGFAAAIGAIIDDAIVYVEHIVRRFREYRSQNETATFSVIGDALLEIGRPIIYATLIAILTILPVFFLGGVTGSFFKPLASSYIIALVSSMFVALAMTSALGFMLFDNAPLEDRDPPLDRWLQNGYHSTFSRIAQTPRSTYLLIAIPLLFAIFAWPFLNHSYLPSFKNRDLVVEVDAPPATSLQEMNRIMSRISQELKAIPGVRNVGAHSGRAVTGDQIVGVNSAQIWVNLDPNVNYKQTVNAIKDTIDNFQGFDRDVQTYLQDTIKEVFSGDNEMIVVRIFGPRRDVLLKQAEEVKRALATIEGIDDLHVEGQVDEPHIEVTVDLAKATPHGIKPGDVRRAAATIFAGIEAGSLFEEQKIFDVVVWSVPQARNSISSIKEILVDKPGGGYVRLGDVADVKIVSAPTVINHEAISPRIDVAANVAGRNVADVVKDVESKLKEINFPLEYHPELVGEYAERQAAKIRFWSVGIAAAIASYFLLQACFGSWSLAALLFFTLPIALTGGVVASLFNESTISLGSLVGFLTILGIAVRNGTVLINRYQSLEQSGMPSGPEVVAKGTGERVAPILTTAITTALALLPFVFLGPIEGLEIIHPMAVVILGGLITSTLLNLVIIPLLYLLFGPSSTTIPQEQSRI